MDFFTAIIFATTLGISVIIIVLPQTLLQVTLTYCAVFIIPLITLNIRANFAVTGGMLVVATGLRICGIKHFQIINMLPALFIVMPVSAI